MNYQFHEVANLFPMMDESAFSDLCEDIKKNGLIEPIWLHNDSIIDGRNRYRACTKVGVEPKFRKWDGNGSLVSFVVSLNMKRRHLNASQKAVVAMQMLPLLEAEARERMKAGGGDRKSEEYQKSGVAGMRRAIETNRSSEEAAEIMGVSPRYIQEVKAIAKEAPEKVKEIQEGKTTVNAAYGELRGKERKQSKKEVKFERKPMISVEEGRCSDANQFAEIAILQLERIRKDDPRRVEALQRVKNFINKLLGE